jgi:hypothetical protein
MLYFYANSLYIEMLIFLVAVYTNYTSQIVDAEGIEPVDEFIGGPKTGKLILRFKKVEEENRGCFFLPSRTPWIMQSIY